MHECQGISIIYFCDLQDAHDCLQRRSFLLRRSLRHKFHFIFMHLLKLFLLRDFLQRPKERIFVLWYLFTSDIYALWPSGQGSVRWDSRHILFHCQHRKLSTKSFPRLQQLASRPVVS